VLSARGCYSTGEGRAARVNEELLAAAEAISGRVNDQMI
jgi:hypothetical protein